MKLNKILRKKSILRLQKTHVKALDIHGHLLCGICEAGQQMSLFSSEKIRKLEFFAIIGPIQI